MIRATAIATILSATAFCGCAELEVSGDQAAIINGAPSAGDDGVGAILVGGSQYCTGTLVTPTIVVTAAHCVPPFVSFPVENIEVFFGPTVGGPGETIRAAFASGNPSWDLSRVAGDVGVIALERPANVLPVPMLAQPLEMMAVVGSTVRMVGFGITDAGGGGNGQRRSGEMEVAAIDESTIHLEPGPSATCSGDSGGPLLLNVDGVEVLAGIHSRSNCISTSMNERVDIHARSFILEFIESHGGHAECGSDGLCAEGCASPDPDCLCGVDGMCTDECPDLSRDLDCECADGECDDAAGCSTGGGGGTRGGFGLLILALAVARRRRRRG